MFEKLLFYLKKITELRNYKLMRQNRNTFVYKRKHNNLGDFRTISFNSLFCLHIGVLHTIIYRIHINIST